MFHHGWGNKSNQTHINLIFSQKNFKKNFRHVVRKPKVLLDVLREDLWNGIQKLRDRSIKLDAPKTMAVDMVVKVTIHLEKIRIARARVAESGGIPIFATSSYLSSEENELEFLRKISEIMIIFLLPRGYSLSPLKNLLSEILAFKSKLSFLLL